ncbi:hypothetical protein JXD38_00330 [candidate division WOR-3 bacterium]|nr:hypothetical protein [candidate division WOR-3 bacterium]
MLPLVLVPLLVSAGFEVGGRIGVVFPASGLETTHDAAALFGANLGYEAGLNRLTLAYAYSGLQARQASPYRFDLHDLSLGYGREFVLGRALSRADSYWGFEASASAGLGLLGRTFNSARETGKAPYGALAVGFFQRQGHSRVMVALDNVVFSESRPAGNTSSVSLTYMLAIKGGVAYVF